MTESKSDIKIVFGAPNTKSMELRVVFPFDPEDPALKDKVDDLLAQAAELRAKFDKE